MTVIPEDQHIPIYAYPGEIEHLLRRADDLVQTALHRFSQSQKNTSGLVESYPSAQAVRPMLTQHLRRVSAQRASLDTIHDSRLTGQHLLGIELQGALVRRGVRIRALTHTTTAIDSVGISRINELVERGVDVRALDERLPSVALLDQHLAILPVGPGPVHRFLALRDPHTVRSLHDFFSAVFGRAVSWTTLLALRSGLDSDVMTQDVLARLAAGCVDEAAARDLRLSVRTYRRHVALIMHKLGARSRFQAGVQAAQLGLLPSDPRRGVAVEVAPPAG